MHGADGVKNLLAAFLALALLSGCSGRIVELGPAALGPVALLEPPSQATVLLVADEHASEIEGFLAAPTAGRFGFRAGLLVPSSAEEGDWGPAAVAGIYYRRVQPAARRWGYEVGLDYASVERDDRFVTSQLYVLRGDVLFGNWGPEGRKASFYVLSGADAYLSSSQWKVTGAEGTSMAAGIKLGFGVSAPRGTWDLRSVYSRVLGSENVKDSLLLVAGFAF